MGESLFEPALCNNRWTQQHYKKHQRILHSSKSTTGVVVTEVASSKSPQSQQQKFRKACVVTDKIAALISENATD